MKALTILLLFFFLPIVSTTQTPSASEKSDVEILKLSWAEVPSHNVSGNPFPVLDASQRAPDRTGTPDLRAVEVRRKEQRTTTSAGDAINAKTPKAKIINYTFSVSIKNTGVKTIQSVQWVYYLFPKDPAAEPVGWSFQTQGMIKPGKKKTLQDTSILMGDLASKVMMPSNATRSDFNDKVVIVHVDYTDGSSWENPSNTQTFPTRKQ